MSTNRDVYGALNDLYDALESAYWAASTVEQKDRIFGVMSIVSHELDELDRKRLRKSNEDYSKLTEEMKNGTARIEQLSRDINGIIHNISVATDVINKVTSLLALLK